ncbi:MAG: glutathione S-transferase family protein [Hyphomicrobium sp.]
MAEKLVFYTHPWSRGRVARWMLEEIGQPYETVALEYRTTMKGPEYLAINPMGKVPALKHGDAIVTENAAICAYLADAFPDAKLAPPPGDKRRAPYYRWLFFAAGPLDAATLNKALGVEPPSDKKGMVGYGSLKEVTDTLEGAIRAAPYLCGDRFTAADLYVGSFIAWTMGFGILEKRPVFEEYVARLKNRPAAKRAAEIDDALIAQARAAAAT